jgi:hypothetical protein
MKALLALIAAFLMVFFLGCQENSITDPGSIDDNALAVQNDQNLTNKDMISAYPGVIKIFDAIYDPTHPQNNGDQIKGFIRYNHQLLPVSSSYSDPTYSVKLKLYVNLEIDAKCPMHSDCMKVVAATDQNVDFAATDHNFYQEVEKVFSVANTCCGGMVLVLKFSVDKDNLELLSMSLKKVSDWTYQIGNPE